MKIKKLSLKSSAYPEPLRHLSSIPQELYVGGADISTIMDKPRVAIVGSRKVSAYGRSVTEKLAGELARAGVVIISGLALGVDVIAHQAAIDAGGITVAVLPGGLDTIYPSSHHSVAKRIIENGGILLSEYPVSSNIYKQNFIARNRIVAGLSDALLITEAAEKSGSLHTARFALEQGIDVLAVPGNITSPTSVGTNNLIRTGAAPITSVDDVFYALGVDPETSNKTSRTSSNNPNELQLLVLLEQGVKDGEELLAKSELPVADFNQTLTMLEINGRVRACGNNEWILR